MWVLMAVVQTILLRYPLKAAHWEDDENFSQKQGVRLFRILGHVLNHFAKVPQYAQSAESQITDW